MATRTEPELTECESCEEEKECYYYDGHPVCDGCLESLENKTGWCGVSCMLGYGCDQSC